MSSPVAHPPSPATQARPEDGFATCVVDLLPNPPDPRSAEAGPPDFGELGPADAARRTAVAGLTPAPRGRVVLSASDPGAAGPPAAVFPEVGTEFLGFRLEGELGRGAFGRVYLARQGELAARPVALKVTTRGGGEPQTLAQLQHTNIVPVYSVHVAGPLQAVCMPYFGSVTLDDVVGGLRARDRVPGSGDHFVSTLNQRRASTTPGPPSGGGDATPPAEARPAPPRPVAATEILAQLSKRSYVEAVLWIGARLADGLAHAHDRGIVHRDLKPANVLLTDEGQPMLLDFNLADDANAPAGGGVGRVGGTLPYMSPEQLEVFRTRAGTVDARTDVYSLGLMLYELLAARHPFPTPSGAVARILPRMVADRRAGPPPLRRHNPTVTPAVQAIVRKCLDPDPAGRYPSARALQEDIERHLAHRPLLHTPEPSLRERFRKWARRNPRLTSSGTTLGLATVLVVGLVLGLFGMQDRLARREAADGWTQFRKDKQRLEAALGVGVPAPGAPAAGLDEAGRVLAGFGVPEDPAWAARPAVALLPLADGKALREEMGELLFLTARMTALESERVRPHDPAAAGELLARAVLLSERAFDCFDAPTRPWVVETQREELGKGIVSAVRVPPEPKSPKDAYLLAVDLATRGQYPEALKQLSYVLGREPSSFGGWFVRGNCLTALENDVEAEGAYSVCVALAPDLPAAYRTRGEVRLRRANFDGAKADFEAYLRLCPDDPVGYLNRAAAHHGLGEHLEEVANLITARARGADRARVHFLTAVAYRARGNARAAERELAAGLAAGDPPDDLGWVTRGLARSAADPDGALTDFVSGLTRNPANRAARDGLGKVLSEKVWRVAGAVPVWNGGW